MPYIFDLVQKEISKIVKEEVYFVVPPSHISADFAFSIGNAEKIEEVMERIKKTKFKFIERAEDVGPLINIYLKKKFVYGEVLENITNKAQNYGSGFAGKSEKVLIEYSSPNIAKPIGVGHLRSTVIGESLARIYKYAGHDVIRENFLGDWGTQFGQLVVAYKKWGDEKKIKKDPLSELKNLYVRFQEESEKDESLKEEARETLRLLENKDEKIFALWEKFRELSIEDFKKVYGTLDIKFDNFSGESFFVDVANEIVDDCLEKGVCKESDEGGIAVEPEELIVSDETVKTKIPSFLVRKNDGATLYIVRDIAALFERVKEHSPQKMIYVVGGEQELHFRQMFFLAEKMKFIDKDVAEHISFGPVLINGKPMSTRGGSLVELRGLLNEAVKKAKEIIKDKNPDIKGRELDETSAIVGVGAVVYNILRQSRQRSISFEWERALNFEGESSVYLQYTYVRIRAIIDRVDRDLFDEDNFPYKAEDFVFESDEEFNLAKKIMVFPKILRESLKRNEPHVIANYLENLSSDFNGFYGKISVINTKDEKLRMSRVVLIKSVASVIKRGLGLLGVDVPERM